MAKAKKQFVCNECGENSTTWYGKCPNCGAFDSIKEFREAKIVTESSAAGVDLSVIKKTNTVDFNGETSRLTTHINEVDRVLGGGFFPGSVTMFGGHPGIGKSTLSLQIFHELSRDHTAMYFSGEESVAQILSRMQRLTGTSSQSIFSTNSLEDIVATAAQQKPKFIVIDSIQMIGSQSSNFGSVSQIRENAETLIKLAKSENITMMIIGHVTKNDELAGPKALEHLVDAVLYLEGEKNSEMRILRSPKNRFGSTMEMGLFEMQKTGLEEIKNPSAFFAQDRNLSDHGACLTIIREGVRNFILEIQALTVKSHFGTPRRTSHGIDLSKFHLLCAVISKFSPFKMDEYDGYLNIVGGLKSQDPAADAAILAAILSSRAEKPINPKTLILGEVGLSGEIRKVTALDARIKEAAKLGFETIIVPQNSEIPDNTSLTVIKVGHIRELIRAIF